jgi:hypothetical protein
MPASVPSTSTNPGPTPTQTPPLFAIVSEDQADAGAEIVYLSEDEPGTGVGADGNYGPGLSEEFPGSIAAAAVLPVETYTHPGFGWLDDAACNQLAEDLEARGENPTSLFFVDAGHVIDTDTRNVCVGCPVRTECILHAYLGGPGGTPINGGYLGGFSLGQRKGMTLAAALQKATAETVRVPRPARDSH